MATPGEIDEYPIPLQLARDTEMAAVDGYELVLLIVETMPGQDDVRVWKRDPLEMRVVENGSGGAGRRLAAEQPVAIHRINAPLARLDGRVRGQRSHGCCRGSQKISPVHALRLASRAVPARLEIIGTK